MRFVHTADWHLGRLFNGVHLTEDQAYVLDGFCDIVRESKPDAIVIAGDIYDRSVPPPDAVDLFNEVLNRLALDIGVPVLCISGNHDSPQRLGFGHRLMARGNVHLFGPMRSEIAPVTLQDDAGPIHFYPIPYAEPSVVRGCLADPEIVCHTTAMRSGVARIGARADAGRKVLIAHAFVVGGAESESERPLTVGGAGTVPADLFGSFNYTALGHLHREQSFNAGAVRYSGSLMKYSFAEADHRKSVNIIEMNGSGECSVECVPLRARRDVRVIEATMEQVLRGPADGVGREDYLHVVLTDIGPIFDAMARIRTVYPNALSLGRKNLDEQVQGKERPVDHTKLSDLDLFKEFFQQVTNEPMTGPQETAFCAVADMLRTADREAGA